MTAPFERPVQWILVSVSFVALLAITVLVVTAYKEDQRFLSEARSMARQDLLDELVGFPRSFAFVAPLHSRFNCHRNTYFTAYVSQICYENHDLTAKGQSVRLYVLYFEPNSLMSQRIYQDNETYFKFSETAEVVARLYGNGMVKKFGSGTTD